LTSETNLAGEEKDETTAEPSTSTKRQRRKRSVQPRKKVKLSTNTEGDADNPENSNDATPQSNTNSTRSGNKPNSRKKPSKTQDDKQNEDVCQDSSALAGGKAKKSVTRKMLIKTEKYQILQHVRSLNPMAIAVIAIIEVIHCLSDREAHLKEVRSNIVPSSTAFYVKHLQEMYEMFYSECSLMKDRYLQFQLKWHNHCSLFLLQCNQELTTMGLHPSDPLAEKVVSVRAQWNRICVLHTISQKEKKKFVMLYSSAVFNHFFTTVSSCFAERKGSSRNF